jgi:hypothetical protein
VDVRKVVELGVTPAVTTGILHLSAGTGQVGAGVAEAPLSCFADALSDLDRRLSGLPRPTSAGPRSGPRIVPARAAHRFLQPQPAHRHQPDADPNRHDVTLMRL